VAATRVLVRGSCSDYRDFIFRYENVPSAQLAVRVPDRTAVSTTADECRCTAPEGMFAVSTVACVDKGARINACIHQCVHSLTLFTERRQVFKKASTRQLPSTSLAARLCAHLAQRTSSESTRKRIPSPTPTRWPRRLRSWSSSFASEGLNIVTLECEAVEYGTLLLEYSTRVFYMFVKQTISCSAGVRTI